MRLTTLSKISVSILKTRNSSRFRKVRDVVSNNSPYSLLVSKKSQKVKLYIDGEVVNDKSPKDRDIAMVFQNYALYPHMTVYENMAFGLKLRKYKKTISTNVCVRAASLGLTGS